jgi:hypothetical protein
VTSFLFRTYTAKMLLHNAANLPTARIRRAARARRIADAGRLSEMTPAGRRALKAIAFWTDTT